MSKRLLNLVDWKLWGDSKRDYGFDKIMTDKIKNLTIKKTSIKCEDIQGFCIDIKSNENLTPISDFTFDKYFDIDYFGFDFSPIKKQLLQISIANQYSVIIPTMWRSEYITEMIQIYNNSKHVHEVIIIDNDKTKRLPISESKVRILEQTENIFVNPAWNLGVSEAKCENVIIANDDIVMSDFDNVINEANKILTENVVIGVDSDCYKSIGNIKIIPAEKRCHGWGCFMILKKKSYVPINENIKIWYGDDVQFSNNKAYKITGTYIKTKMSTTVRSQKCTAKQDQELFHKHYTKDCKEIKYTTKKMRVSINMATYPAREKTLSQVVNSLLPQCDILRVYLNEYTYIPKCLKQPKILVHFGGENIKDTGKFFWAGTIKNEYYFTVDDDFIYPPDYVAKHVEAIQKHNSVVCIHGRILKKYPQHPADVEKVFEYFKDLYTDEKVNYCGTGTVAFDNSRLAVDLSIFKSHGLCDEYFSAKLQKANIPIICRKHKSDELQSLKYTGLWNSYRERKHLFQQIFTL